VSRALSPSELAAWERDGFVLRRGAFARDEVDRLLADASLASGHAAARHALCVDRRHPERVA
jgi:hypothetical protein